MGSLWKNVENFEYTCIQMKEHKYSLNASWNMYSETRMVIEGLWSGTNAIAFVPDHIIY